MATSTQDAERDREWQAMLDAWRPPHRSGDWVSPALGKLLRQAARKPLLRKLFPWTSMNQFHVSATGDFRDYAHEPFPAIAASHHGFVVMAHPWGLEHVVRETTDPSVALACMARILQGQGAFGIAAGPAS